MPNKTQNIFKKTAFLMQNNNNLLLYFKSNLLKKRDKPIKSTYFS